MPVVGSSAYVICSDVTALVRVILNDSEIPAGDVYTDTSPFTFPMINSALDRVQLELAKVGVEVQLGEEWFIALPTMPIQDPEGLMVIDDTGCNILYPNGTGDVLANSPQLPVDLILPLKLWERQSGTTNYAEPMHETTSGLGRNIQGQYLCEWEWKTDGLRFRGATQSQDVKMEYEKRLPRVVTVDDPVPIRGCLNALAYYAADLLASSRGGVIAPKWKTEATENIFLLQQVSARRKQRKPTRRKPFGYRRRFYRNI